MAENNAPAVIPSLRYRDAMAAIDWLERAFGFERVMVVEGDDGTVAHAELLHDDGMIMLGTEREDMFGPHVGRGWAYVIVDDADAHYERAKAAGAEIVRELEDQPYGSRDYSARDPEGNLWSFGTYRPSLEPQPD
jgi:uncharacterized glyoxalase superfamily protein PhnB